MYEITIQINALPSEPDEFIDAIAKQICLLDRNIESGEISLWGEDGNEIAGMPFYRHFMRESLEG